MGNNEFDYIIVGAGSAGAVLATRLTEDPTITVLLLEAGGPDYRFDFRTQMPAALSIPLQGKRYNWDYKTDPEPHMNHRRMQCGRGKGLGGSSLINGMCYIRGNALDYDNWAKRNGLSQWSYLHCLPYFKKAETRDIGANAYHGDSGPVSVTTPKNNNLLYHALVEAGVQAGFPITDDLNGYRQEGFGPMDRTVTPTGRRASVARGYLDQAKPRPNLTIILHATADRIIFENKKAVGLHFYQQKSLQSVYAKREVIVSAGAIASPALLQRSGVGPAALLKELDIPLVQTLPVGENLQDHLELYIQYQCKEPISLAPYMKWYRKPAVGAKWLFFGRGVGATNHFEAGGFIRSNDTVEWPNIQYHFLPLAVSYNGSNPIAFHSFQAHMGSMRSKSRGRIKIRSKDPHQDPSILFNYMSDADDWQEFREGIRITREIMSQPALQHYRGRAIALLETLTTDAQLDSFVREYAETAFHPCGSNRMGDDADCVVDAEGRVHGLQGLRVVDASIMPIITTGNLNAPTIMIAEKIADQIKGKSPLEAISVPYYVAK